MELNKINNEQQKKKQNSNLYWIIGILFFCVIVLSYFAFFVDKKIEESEIIKFITYTSSLLSIVLSCFAIIYAYLTSFDTSNKLSSMDSKLQSINTMSSNINQSYESLHHLVQGLNNYIYKHNFNNKTNNDTINKEDDMIKGNQYNSKVD
ncbi:MAG: hypothetical protein UE068_13845 [Paludibacteraceae bacterium]|nr:hypothetical protein [Paludibacteraceae bacterium]